MLVFFLVSFGSVCRYWYVSRGVLGLLVWIVLNIVLIVFVLFFVCSIVVFVLFLVCRIVDCCVFLVLRICDCLVFLVVRMMV